MAHPESLDASGFDPDVLAKHAQFVRRLARGLVRDGDAAEELTARTLAAAVERRPDTGPGFRVWLERVTWRLFLRERRDRERRDRRERGAASPEPTRPTVDLVAELDLQRNITRAFEELAEPSKSALYLRYFRDLGPGEIAAQLGVPVSTVKSRLQRGLEALRERLDALHEGKREAWLQALLPWVGGPAMVATKSKGVAIAAAAVVLIGIGVGVGGFAAWKRGDVTHAAPVSVESSVASAESAAATKGAAAEAKEATPTRAAVEPARGEPFATGIVVDEGGTPLADVAVVVTRLNRHDGPNEQAIQEPLRLDRLERDRLATTDAQGRFAVVEPGVDLVALVFLKAGFATTEWSEFSSDRSRNRDHRVVLAAGSEMRGRVVDREHRPVPLAMVRLFPTKLFERRGAVRAAVHLEDAPTYTMLPGEQRTTSDAAGAFAFTSAGRSDFQVYVLASGYTPVTREDASLSSPCELTLARDALLLDVVDADSGSPLRAAMIVVDAKKGTVLTQAVSWLPKDVDHSVLAPAGQLLVNTGYGVATVRSEVPWIASAKDGRIDVELHVVAAGHVGEIVDATISKDEEPPHLRVELAPDDDEARDASITGRVRGAKRAEVRAYCLIPNFIDTAMEAREPLLVAACDGDGHFALHDLPPARYRLFARAPGVAPESVDVEAPARDVTIDIQAASVIEVEVTDHAGAPAVGVVAHAQRPDRSRAWYAKTDTDGVARLEGLPAGPFLVGAFEDLRYDSFDPAVCFPLTAKAFTDATVVEVKPGGLVRVERALVERLPTRFHFKRDDGAPVANLRFEFSGFDGPVSVRHGEMDRLRRLAPELDANGDAPLDLDPGLYDFRVSDGGPAREAHFEIPPASDGPITIRIPVLRESGSLVGRVVDSVTGKPITNRKVSAIPRGGGPQSIEPEMRLTDDDGRFRFDALPVGSLRVAADADAIGDQQRWFETDPTSPYTAGSQECVVESGRETKVEFTLPPIHAKGAAFPTLDLVARVTDATTGLPLEKAYVVAHARVGATDVEVGTWTTDAEGRVRTPVFAAEKYAVSIYGPFTDGDSSSSAFVQRTLTCAPTDGVLTIDAALAKAH